MSDHTYRVRDLVWRSADETLDDAGTVHDAMCVCGWQSPVYPTYVGAELAAGQHSTTAPHVGLEGPADISWAEFVPPGHPAAWAGGRREDWKRAGWLRRWQWIGPGIDPRDGAA
jgi:hypothetical protein